VKTVSYSSTSLYIQDDEDPDDDDPIIIIIPRQQRRAAAASCGYLRVAFLDVQRHRTTNDDDFGRAKYTPTKRERIAR